MIPTITLICDHCGGVFIRETRVIRRSIKRGTTKAFCSRSCSSRGKRVTRDQTGDKNSNWKGGITCSESVMASRKKHPERCLARNAIYRAVKNGVIKRPKECDICCAAGPITAHHDDYSKRMEVEWLCNPCHKKADKRIKDKDGLT